MCRKSKEKEGKSLLNESRVTNSKRDVKGAKRQCKNCSYIRVPQGDVRAIKKN